MLLLLLAEVVLGVDQLYCDELPFFDGLSGGLKGNIASQRPSYDSLKQVEDDLSEHDMTGTDQVRNSGVGYEITLNIPLFKFLLSDCLNLGEDVSDSKVG